MSGAQRFKDDSSIKYIDLQSNSKKTDEKQNRNNKDYINSLKNNNNDKKLGWLAISKDSRFKYS